MRIVFLNTWVWNKREDIDTFIRGTKADIFCFQEVSLKIVKDLEKKLPGFNNVYHSGGILSEFEDEIGQATFVKKEFPILGSSKVVTYKNKVDEIGFLLYTSIDLGKKKLFLGNVHGKVYPVNKLDVEERVSQSKNIIDFFERKEGPRIIGGDFNLEIKTESIKMFEDAGYENLIKKFGIKNTRNRVSWRKLKKGQKKQHFADYCFISSEVRVKDFEAPYMEISDHLPLILDFEA